METRKVSEIIFRKDLYPRLSHDPVLVQEYADNIAVLPPIEINQENELIDGFHRWTAYRSKEQSTIPVEVTETESDVDILELAIERNSKHGHILSMADKKSMAQTIYKVTPVDQQTAKKKHLESLLSVTERTIYNWLRSIDDDRRDAIRKYAFDLYMECVPFSEIAENIGRAIGTVSTWTSDFEDFQILKSSTDEETKELRQTANFEDEDFQKPIYDIWNFSKKTNEVGHYGNTEARIVENLLYLLTDPFDIILDPFAGGGSTIDVCKKRYRRYWVSDRLPIVERENEIKEHDIVTDGVFFPEQKSGEVALVYLDPPYWKQAAGKYSDDRSDLANMTLEDFTEKMVNIIDEYGHKLKSGAHIACIISPTQWPNDDKSTNYHDIDFINAVGSHLKLERHIICPYSTEQYNGTQVNIAKECKLNMVISRRLIVWEVA